MNLVRGEDLPFYAAALVLLGLMLAAALGGAERRRGLSRFLEAASLAGLFAGLGAWSVGGAAIGAAVAGETIARSKREHEEAFVSGTRNRRPALLLVVAFAIVVARAVLIARWPLAASSLSGISPPRALVPDVGLLHYLLVAIAAFSVGLFAVLTRLAASGMKVGVEIMGEALALGLVSVSRYVGGAGQGDALAAIVLLWPVVAAAAARCLDLGDSSFSPAGAERLAQALTVLLAAATLAMVAGAW